MKDGNYEVGDEVRILKDNSCHDLKIGETFKIERVKDQNSIRVSGMYLSWDEIELVTPTAPFTRAEIDALVLAYPEANVFRFASREICEKTSSEYPYEEREPAQGRRVMWGWAGECRENQISLRGDSEKKIATWTKGDPLPGIECADAEPPVSQEKIREHFENGLRGTRVDFAEGRAVTRETTHTFSAELPSGDVVEMPSPGDDWIEGEREEFKRGDCRCGTVDDDTVYESDFSIETIGDIKLKTNSQKCWMAEYAQILPDFPILSITTWSREIKQPYDIEDLAYLWDTAFGVPSCPSYTNTIGLEVWPGRDDG